MQVAHTPLLEDFGTRSLLIHGIMVITFINAVLAGLFVSGELGLIAFVGLLGVSTGLWVGHSIHSLGNVAADGEYSGVVNELFDTDGSGAGFNVGRFGRLLVLIAAVTAVSLLTSAQVLGGAALSIVAVAIGAVAVITALVGFLIAMGASYDAAQERSIQAGPPTDPPADRQ